MSGMLSLPQKLPLFCQVQEMVQEVGSKGKTQEKPKLHLYKVSPSTSEGGVEPDFIGPARCGGMITKLSNFTLILHCSDPSNGYL